jgi:hypothetical protein
MYVPTIVAGAEREKQRQEIQTQVANEKRPLLVFPEGWDNNGRGLMVYQKYCFSLGVKIVPTALSVRIPFLPLVRHLQSLLRDH